MDQVSHSNDFPKLCHWHSKAIQENYLSSSTFLLYSSFFADNYFYFCVINFPLSGKFAHSLFPQQPFIKPQETLCRVLDMDALSQIGNSSGRKPVVWITVAEDGQNRTGVILLSPPWPCCPQFFCPSMNIPWL